MAIRLGYRSRSTGRRSRRAPARAATYCVDTSAPGCAEQPSVAAALDAAASEPGTDTVLIGRRSESTDRKTSLNQALRDFAVPV